MKQPSYFKRKEGTVAWGYRVAGPHSIVEVPELLAVLPQAFEYAEAIGYRDAAKWLTLKTGVPLNASNLYQRSKRGVRLYGAKKGFREEAE
jgi:hypothetical protein|tara:strand:- start:581 stop:853 length:273 start_codon:yes stop_codon:yes gene_type:complete